MNLNELFKHVPVVKNTITRNGNSYDVPFNQSEEFYLKAGMCNDPDNSLSYLTHSKFNNKFDNLGNPIFDLTYCIPLNSAIEIGLGGFYILNNFNKDNISISINDGTLVLNIQGRSSCLTVDYPTEKDCLFCEWGENSIERFNNYFHYNINGNIMDNLANQHICSLKNLYEAEIGIVSETGFDSFRNFTANCNSRVYDIAHCNANTYHEFIESIKGDYSVKCNYKNSEYMLFLVENED